MTIILPAKKLLNKIQYVFFSKELKILYKKPESHLPLDGLLKEAPEIKQNFDINDINDINEQTSLLQERIFSVLGRLDDEDKKELNQRSKKMNFQADFWADNIDINLCLETINLKLNKILRNIEKEELTKLDDNDFTLRKNNAEKTKDDFLCEKIIFDELISNKIAKFDNNNLTIDLNFLEKNFDKEKFIQTFKYKLAHSYKKFNDIGKDDESSNIEVVWSKILEYLQKQNILIIDQNGNLFDFTQYFKLKESDIKYFELREDYINRLKKDLVDRYTAINIKWQENKEKLFLTQVAPHKLDNNYLYLSIPQINNQSFFYQCTNKKEALKIDLNDGYLQEVAETNIDKNMFFLCVPDQWGEKKYYQANLDKDNYQDVPKTGFMSVLERKNGKIYYRKISREKDIANPTYFRENNRVLGKY